jgi:hypothetical protein
VLAGGASAQDNSNPPLSCPSSSLTVAWSQVDIADLADDTGQTFSDGTLTVQLTDPAPIPGYDLTILTVGSLHFTASRDIGQVNLQLWQAPGVFTYTGVTFAPAVTSGNLTSPDGSHPDLGHAPIKGLVFCYEKPVVPTTAAPTTTVEVLPEVVTAAPTTAPTTAPTVAVEVLPQVVTAPEQIAFTGSSSGPLVTLGAVLVLLGLAFVGRSLASSVAVVTAADSPRAKGFALANPRGAASCGPGPGAPSVLGGSALRHGRCGR